MRSRILRGAVVPLGIYLIAFMLFTYPAILFFNTRAFMDTGDGFTNLWNLWWIRRALLTLHQSPWFTQDLHFPFGVSLVGHTLNLVNGLCAIPLGSVFSQVQTYNLLLIGLFVVSGYTTYLLAYAMTGAYAGSLLAGALFTFCEYHFAHAQGHLNLVSCEGIPLFLLAWIRWLRRPDFRWMALAAGTLLWVLFSDYYYFFYCGLMVPFSAFAVLKAERLRRWGTQYAAGAAFGGAVVAGVGAPVFFGLRLFKSVASVVGTHSSAAYSMDALAPFVPGSHWRFGSWTSGCWTRWTGNPHESSVYVGWSVLLLLAYGWRRRRLLRILYPKLWYGVVFFFLIMALGPQLHIAGRAYTGKILPYALMERALPFLQLSGCPVRMMVMAQLAISILAGAAFAYGWRHWRWRGTTAALFFLGFLFEYWPSPLPLTPLEPPAWTQALRQMPGPGGVIDTWSDSYSLLYCQTCYEKPVGLGMLARIPHDVELRDAEMVRVYRAGDFETLAHQYRFHYMVAPANVRTLRPYSRYRTLFDDQRVIILDLWSPA